MSRRAIFLFLLLLVAGCGTTAPDLSAIAPPDDAWFKENVTSQTTPVVVDFTASWCGPCQMLKPFLEAMEKNHPGAVKVVPIDVDSRPDLVSHYGLSGSVPVLLMIKQGKVVDICRGAPPSYDDLMSWAGPHLK
ncbi:MAG TPA: thioredoxin domain-containing protein [Caulifigura sp.]|nr:thioredoxin domain-containing protein [Caulifigura sp.]